VLTHRPIDLVREGLDLAVRASLQRLEDSSLTMRRLSRGEGFAYASPTYLARRGAPRTPGDPAHDWVLFRDARPRQLGLPADLRPRVVCDDLLFLRDVLRAGGGVGVLPSLLGEPFVHTGELVRVLPELHVRGEGYVLLYPSSGQVPRKVTAFRDMLVEATRRLSVAASDERIDHAA
jgi:DNA-binding transcriptional LysR family regulator